MKISSPFFSVILPYIFPASNLEGNVEIAVPTFLMGANKNIKGKLGPYTIFKFLKRHFNRQRFPFAM